MSLTIEIASRHDFAKTDLWAMHKLRAKVFSNRLGWEVPIMSGMEIDGYDAIDPHYMMMHEPGGELRGCWRLLPTEGPYMLKDSFPQLLHGTDAPADPKIWELSRFAIETDKDKAYGFSSIAMHSIAEIIAYGYENEINQYVTVTTTAIERMLRKAGIVMRRFGPPVVIGVENAVALYIDIAESFEALRPVRSSFPLTSAYIRPSHQLPHAA
jgi:acyl homoserine lactone synthase